MVRIEMINGDLIEIKPCFVFDLFKQFNISEDSVLIMKDSILVTPDIHLKSGDKVKIIPVISGG